MNATVFGTLADALTAAKLHLNKVRPELWNRGLIKQKINTPKKHKRAHHSHNYFPVRRGFLPGGLQDFYIPLKSTNKKTGKKVSIRIPITKPHKRDGKTFLSTITKMPRGKMRRRKSNITNGFAKTKLVKLKSVHMVDINPGSSSAVASLIINVNNPLDPFDQVNSVNETFVSTEHHPKFWSTYENIYDKYQPISCKVSVRALTGSGNTSAFAMSLIACSEENFSECSAIAHTTRLFPIRLKEAYGNRALIQYHSSSATTPDNLFLSKAVNVRKLEGILDKHDIDTLQGNTSKSGSETIPGRAPKMILSYGSLRETQDLDIMSCVVTIEYVVLLSGLSDVEGANV